MKDYQLFEELLESTTSESLYDTVFELYFDYVNTHRDFPLSFNEMSIDVYLLLKALKSIGEQKDR